MTARARPAAPHRTEAGAPPWRRLDGRTVVVTVTAVAAAGVVVAVPTGLAIAAGGRHGPAALAWSVAGIAVLTTAAGAADVLRWHTTGYRLGGRRLELRRGILLQHHRSLPRERIRAVDLSAHPLLRVLGLVRVRIGTGERSGGWPGLEEQEIVLDPVRRAEGERLRRVLLTDAARPGGPAGEQLAGWDLAWSRHSPLSLGTLGLAGGAAAVTLQVADWFDAGGLPVDLVRALVARLGPWPALLVVLAGAAPRGTTPEDLPCDPVAAAAVSTSSWNRVARSVVNGIPEPATIRSAAGSAPWWPDAARSSRLWIGTRAPRATQMCTRCRAPAGGAASSGSPGLPVVAPDAAGAVQCTTVATPSTAGPLPRRGADKLPA